MKTHLVKRITAPDGSRAEIDAGLVPVIRALWDAGLETVGCCQDVGESVAETSERLGAQWKGYAQLEMPCEDACALLDIVKVTPQFRSRMHWAADGAWEISTQVLPFGLDGDAAVVPWAQIRFPKEQAADLLTVLRRQTAAVAS